jgi:DNA-directed RNA polymerase subunit RPC12/RpoP
MWNLSAKSMSEYKYACPVCGQHMMCDSSQAGSVMECPTCFQKITAPQAPTGDDQKFVLTGSQVTERKIPTTPGVISNSSPAAKSFSGALVVVIVLIFIGTAVAFVYRGTIFKSKNNSASDTAEKTDQLPAKKQSPPKPAVVAPPASDANWTLSPITNAIPDSPVAGRIHGQDFLAERASFSTNGVLMIRAGTRGALEFGVQINFSGAPAESLSGQTINVSADTDKAAKISFRWKDDDGTVQKGNFDSGYAMRLEFGALANNRLPGKIYLCTPDAEKSYLMGTFNADARKPKPKTPKP